MNEILLPSWITGEKDMTSIPSCNLSDHDCCVFKKCCKAYKKKGKHCKKCPKKD